MKRDKTDNNASILMKFQILVVTLDIFNPKSNVVLYFKSKNVVLEKLKFHH